MIEPWLERYRDLCVRVIEGLSFAHWTDIDRWCFTVWIISLETCYFEVNKVNHSYRVRKGYKQFIRLCVISIESRKILLSIFIHCSSSKKPIERSTTFLETFITSIFVWSMFVLSVSLQDMNGSFNSFILTLFPLLTSYPVMGFILTLIM